MRRSLAEVAERELEPAFFYQSHRESQRQRAASVDRRVPVSHCEAAELEHGGEVHTGHVHLRDGDAILAGQDDVPLEVLVRPQAAPAAVVGPPSISFAKNAVCDVVVRADAEASNVDTRAQNGRVVELPVEVHHLRNRWSIMRTEPRIGKFSWGFKALVTRGDCNCRVPVRRVFDVGRWVGTGRV
jgi:hypothetical protein